MRSTKPAQPTRLYLLLAFAIGALLLANALPDRSSLDFDDYSRPTRTPMPTPLPGIIRLISEPSQELSPAWSPDGAHIAVVACCDSSGSYLNLTNVDGPNLRTVTTFPSLMSEPVWSPDGARIAFTGANQIYVVHADGSGLTSITQQIAEGNVFSAQPAWSPDGTSIALVSDFLGTPDVYVIDVNAQARLVELTRLTDNHAWTQHPVWSSDGKRIAFDSTRDGNIAIYVTDVACARRSAAVNDCVTRLTDPASENREPSWSPDGERIAFTSLRDGNPEIYAMNADGSSQTRLTHSPDIDWLPAWSPDGTRVAFLSGPSLEGQRAASVHNDVYIVRPDGSGLQRLTNDGLVGSMAWSPDGRRIAFVSHKDADNLDLCSRCNTDLYVVSVQIETRP